MPLPLLTLEGDNSAACGYCQPHPFDNAHGTESESDSPSSKSSHSYGISPASSGIPCAIVDGEDQYTIRLDALEFWPSRSHRQVTNRWNRFILGEDAQLVENPRVGNSKPKGPAFDVVTNIHSAETAFLQPQFPPPVHRFEVTLEPPSFTPEKFALYEKYQRAIHNEGQKTPGAFRRFLVDSPLQADPIPYPAPPPPHLPRHYGAYHQCYRIDGVLCALAVLDILPQCVSSVYFMYDPRWERFSLGKISVLREAALAREIHAAGVPAMRYLYMGFYVHSCAKMHYKGAYAPSYLLDPEEYTWFPFAECTALLTTHRYACFSHPEHSLRADGAGAGDGDTGSARDTLPALDDAALCNITVLESAGVVRPTARARLLRGVSLLGPEIARAVALSVHGGGE